MCAIESCGLAKTFRKNAVLKSISFSAHSGEMTLIAGENGAGKTTWIKAALGLIKPTGGFIAFDSLPVSQARKRVSAVFDEPSLYSHLSGWDNIRFLSGIQNPDLDLLSDLKTGLRLNDSFLAMRGRKYSLGQRRRIAVCAALIRKPDYLFMDEPAIGLDPIAWKMVREAISEICHQRKVAVVITGQNYRDLEDLIDRIVVIKEGLVCFNGSVDKMRKLFKPGLTIKTDDSMAVLNRYPQALVDTSNGISICRIECEGVKDAERLLQEVLKSGISIQGVDIRQASLEEAFTSLTQGDRSFS